MGTFDFTEIAQALITLIAALISAVAVPWIKGKVGEQNMNDFLRWVEIAVAAAEQIYTQTEGEKKKRYVLNYLYNKGIEIDETDIDLAIEAAVLKLHNDLYDYRGDPNDKQP
ncbi:MAG: hypothetical protein J6U82_06735 [Alistipes sp.]|nr:hypothetical protein [Alistipes sp.]